ncbi:hypothetical protein AAMO2058_000103700 [Amorphochlora amoebiformis]
MLYITPRPTQVCTQILKDRAVLGDVTVRGIHLGFIPVDADVMSLETPGIWRSVFLDSEISGLWNVAHSLMKLQLFFGLIPKLSAKGEHACTVVSLMKRMCSEADPEMYDASASEIDHCVVLDRSVDLVSPMMTQMTYEGVIDELIGIRNSCVEVDASVTASKGNKRGKTIISLNSSDHLYREIRDFHYRTLGSWLHKKTSEVRNRYDEVKSSSMVKSAQDTTIGQMKDVVKKLKVTSAEHNYLLTHTNLAHHFHPRVKSLTFDQKIEKEKSLVGDTSNCEEYVEAQIAQAKTFEACARLLCLLSHTRTVYPKRLTFFINEIVESFGYPVLFALRNLQKVGAIADISKRCPWPTLKKRLALWKENVNTKKPDDVRYVYAGYSPVSVRLVEHAHGGGWSKIKDVLDLLPGPVVETKQLSRKKAPPPSQGTADSKKKKTTLVVFVGGVTYAEISALRKLGELNGRQYLVAATHFTNGGKLVSELREIRMLKARAGSAPRRI